MATSSDPSFVPGLLDRTQQTTVNVTNTLQAVKDVQHNGVTVDTAVRSRINFIDGAGGTMTVADNAASDRVDVTINPGITYRKTSSKTVASSVAETDLLNGEITVAAGAMSTNRLVRLTAWGQLLLGTSATAPRFKVKLGGTVFFDTGAPAGQNADAANYCPWRIVVEIINQGATNVQSGSLDLHGTLPYSGNGAASGVTALTTGEGSIGYYGSITGAYGGMIWNGEGWNQMAVDTTVAQALTLTVINGANAANQVTTLQAALVEII